MSYEDMKKKTKFVYSFEGFIKEIHFLFWIMPSL